jgi:hypothetical protein
MVIGDDTAALSFLEDGLDAGGKELWSDSLPPLCGSYLRTGALELALRAREDVSGGMQFPCRNDCHVTAGLADKDSEVFFLNQKEF